MSRVPAEYRAGFASEGKSGFDRSLAIKASTILDC